MDVFFRLLLGIVFKQNSLERQPMLYLLLRRLMTEAMAPWDGINALDAMVQAFNNMNALRQSMLPSMRLHGVIVEGGKAANIIPFPPQLSLSELQ
jgi:hypothetical protein